MSLQLAHVALSGFLSNGVDSWNSLIHHTAPVLVCTHEIPLFRKVLTAWSSFRLAFLIRRVFGLFLEVAVQDFFDVPLERNSFRNIGPQAGNGTFKTSP